MTEPEAEFSSAESLARNYHLDSICDRFEAAWKGGGEPGIEEFLKNTDQDHAKELFEELVHVDMFYRHRNGESSSIDDYILRFPQYSTDLTLPRKTRSTGGSGSETNLSTQKIGDYELRDEIGAGSWWISI